VRATSKSKIVWDCFIIILAIYNCLLIPLQISFQPKFLETTPFIAIDNLIDFIFCLDIFIGFRTSFINIETGDEVLNSKLTA
jgi:hypothetical protein